MSLFGTNIVEEQQRVFPETTTAPPSNENVIDATTKDFDSSSNEAETSTKRALESVPFHYQFNEVEKAMANFTKHQPFNHHYAPNVHMNRNRNHYNNSRQNSGTNNGNGNNYNSTSNNPGAFQHQANFAMTAQLKQQQHQQFLNQGMQNINRFKSTGNLNGLATISGMNLQSQQGFMQSQYPESQQMYQEQQQQQQALGGVFQGNDLKFTAFQGQPQFQHPNLLSPLRNSSPTFSAPLRPDSISAFGSPLDQMSSNSSFGLNINGSSTQPSTTGDYVDKKLTLDDSSSAYLGNIWGNSKSMGNSTSVWA
jgi:hypothetical protein